MEIDPITLCLVCFPPIGSREGERKIDRGKQRCGGREGKGKRGSQRRRGKKWDRRKLKQKELSKSEKDVEKRQEDMVYVIRGDGMAVGAVSCLDWQAGSACISMVLIGDHHWVR